MAAPERQRPHVPKFSSFRPRAQVDRPQGTAEGGTDALGRAVSPQRQRRPGGDESLQSRSEGKLQSRSRSRSRSRFRSRSRSWSRSRSRARLDRAPDVGFTIDKTGDALIRRYGANHNRDVPVYTTFGSGRVLGAARFLRLERVGNHDEFCLRGPHEGRSVLSSHRRSLLRVSKGPAIRLRKERAVDVTESPDFVPLRSGRKRKRSGSSPDDDARASYRSIQGKSKAHEHSDSDELRGSRSAGSSEDSDQQGAEDSSDPIKLKTMELSSRVRDHPNDMGAWMELVKHQDTLLSLSGSDGHRGTAAEIKSYADIKLSLLNKALKKAETKEQRELLSLRIMREGSKTWDARTTAKRWEEVMKEHGASFSVWKVFATFRQADLLTFNYDAVKELYISRLRVLHSELLARKGSEATNQDLYDELVYLTLRMTRFLSDAGYAELATAVWQATLELTFCRPSDAAEGSDGDSGAVPAAFRDFWESEVARMGEDEARGWASYVADRQSQEAPEPKVLEAEQDTGTRDAYRAWALAEEKRASQAKLPARTLDGGAEDDPYRVVMYQDIEDMLTFVPTQALPVIGPQMLDAFLIFCQYPPASGTSKVIQDILEDDVLNSGRSEAFEVDSQHADTSADTVEAPNGPGTLGLHADYQRMAMSTDTLFGVPHCFQYIQGRVRGKAVDHVKLVQNTLKQLTMSHGMKELASYYLSFESVHGGEIKSTAKKVVKMWPTDASLYQAYAAIDYRRGKGSAARKTVSAALGLPMLGEADRLRLRLSWAWMELEDGQLKKALCRLCPSFDGGEDLDSVSLRVETLKARQQLSIAYESHLSSGEMDKSVEYGQGLALLEYLKGHSDMEARAQRQGDMQSAMACVTSLSDQLVSRGFGGSAVHERLLQFAGRLLHCDASHGPHRPAQLRAEVERLVRVFARNTIFLTLLAWREPRLSIEDRVRALLQTAVVVEGHDCVSSRVFAIRHEARVGNAHSTRAAFEGAVASERCRHHVGLWISYIRFCHRRRELRGKAKDVFYRALQHCPWSKDVLMEAFVTLGPDMMDSSELKSVYNTLCEKGLRVHVELDRFVNR